MLAAQVKPASPWRRWLKAIQRLVSVIAFAALVGFVMRHALTALERSSRPAGFTRGMLQGALMPCALPNLLIGQDVSIYNENNVGVPYKLGYTCGVNACGAIFFGVFFLRINRWRKRARSA